MSSKRIQTQMQINVSFLANTTNLVKQLNNLPNQLNLSGKITEQLNKGVGSNLQNLSNNLNKMLDGLSKPGLNAKQYTSIFDNYSLRIKDNITNLAAFEKELQKVYDSAANKESLRRLDNYTNKLKKLKDMASTVQGSQSRIDTAKGKMKDELGIDFDASAKYLKSYRDTKKAGVGPTSATQKWIDANGLTEAQLKRALELLKQIEEQTKKINTLNTKATTMTGKKDIETGIMDTQAKIEAQRIDALTPGELKEAQATYTQFKPIISELVTLLNGDLKGAFENALGEGNRQAQELIKAETTLKQVFSQFGINFSFAGLINQFKKLIVYSYNFYKSLDSALNAIYVVSDLGAAAVNSLTDQFISMARRTGMSIDDVTKSAVLFFQQGLNTDEVMEMTEVTAEFAKVAGISAADAADKLTAAVNGYCLAAEDAATVADKFNQVAAASAADIDELSTAFSKAAAQANQAGVGMDNYLAYIATMVEATREAPENIGTSLKTIMSRMQQVKEAGTTEDGDTDVNQVETALKSVGVQLRDTQGELKDLEEVLGELGPKWQSLDRNTQAYLGTIIAGTRQQSRFITLMQNWDRVLELAAESENSAGMQALMHAKAMESIESKTKQLSVAWQNFVSNLMNSDVIKIAVDLLTKLVDLMADGHAPMLLLIAALSGFRKQITGGLTSLSAWVGNMSQYFRLVDKEGKGLRGFISTLKNQTKAFATNAVEIERNKKLMADLDKEISAHENTLNGLRQQKPTDGISKQIKREETTIQTLKQQRIDLGNSNAQLEAKNNQLSASFNNITNSALVLSAVFVTMSASQNKLIATLGKTLSVITGVATIALQAGVAFSNFSLLGQAAAKKLSKTVQSELIATGFGALFVILGQAISLVTQLVDAFKVSDSDLAQSVENVGNALGTFSNAKTMEKSATKAIKEYQALANKIYLTSTEQEKLNTLAQQLGDSLDLETIEDEFGNLTISIEQAREKLNELKEESAKTRLELIKTEQEEIEKYDHNNSVGRFYERYLKGYRSDIRNSLSDLDIGLDADEFATSSANVKNIMDNLKDTIIDDVAEMSEALGGLGIEWSLTEAAESMIESFERADIDASEWNNLFRAFETLQESIDSLSYDKALDVVKDAISAWGVAAQLSSEQIQILTNSVMNSLYGSSNLHNTVNKYQNIIDKSDPNYYSNKQSEYDAERKRLYKESSTNWNPFKQDDYEKEYEYWGRKKDLLSEEEDAYKQFLLFEEDLRLYEELGLQNTEEYRNTLKNMNDLKEQYGFYTKEEIAKAKEMVDILGKFGDTSGQWFSNVGMFDEDAEDLLKQMQGDGSLTRIISQYGLDEKEGTKALTDYLVDVIKNSDDEEMRKVAQDKLNNVFDNIEISATMSWGELSKELDDISKDLQSMNKVLEEFKENGGFTLDTFGELCDLLDGMDIGAVFDSGQIDNYMKALAGLKLGFDESTGMITANGNALKSLGEIQEVLARAKITQTKQSLLADRASLQSQIYGVEAEIKANEALIENLKGTGQATMKVDEIKERGQIYYNNAMNEAVTLTGQQYQDMVTASSTWAEASITNAAKVGDAIKKAMTGDLGTANLNTYLEGIVKEMTWENTGSGFLLDMMDKNDKDEVVIADLITELEKYNTKGRNTIKSLYSQMKSIDSMIGLLDQMEKADLSKLGLDIDDKEMEKYIGQLKEIYNILNRIYLLEHRLSTLDSYADLAAGEQYGSLLKERLAYNKELVDQYTFLTKEQKAFTNGYKEFIEGINGLEGVFAFDEFGQIIINWEEYNSLQDEALEGQVSLKEQADDVYKTYTEMFEELQGYFDSLIDYYAAVIDMQQEMIDSYIDLENEAADAIQEIYQKILDTKLDAIDKEIEALNDLKDARDRANKSASDAKEISGLQSDIQRAMMDTSGASDIALLQAQDSLDEKLNEMAEDKYSEMLDDIIQQLENEQEALQDEFDEMFENLQWLFSWLDEDIMGDESALYEILRQTDDWNQKSFLEQQERLKEWETKFHTYYEEMLSSDNGIVGIYNSLQENIQSIKKLDETLKSELAKSSSEIARTIANWQQKVDDKKDLTGDPLDDDGPKDYLENKSKDVMTKYYQGDYNEDVTHGTFGTVDIQGHRYQPDNVKGSKLTATGAKASDVGIYRNSSGVDVKSQNLWKSADGKYYIWNGSKNKYEDATTLVTACIGRYDGSTLQGMKELLKARGYKYKQGGFANFTGPAWLDGTPQKPEAVLNALQTEHFIKFTNALDKMFSGVNTGAGASSISIENISFNVDSMSSVADGEKAFDAFVNKFKEIGSQKGIKINSFKNTL